MNEHKSKELRQKLAKSFDDSLALELARELSDAPGDRGEARELMLKAVASNPSNLRARLQLAKLFYLDGFIEHSVRELIELRRRSSSPALGRLIDSFGAVAKEFSHLSPSPASSSVPESIVGELDLDFDDAEDEV